MTNKIDPKKDPARRVLKEDAWPEADRRAWRAATREGDVLDESGPGAGWAPLTRATVAKGYGRWLGWLQRNQLLDLELPPVDRITAQNVARYITDLRVVNAPYTVRSRILNLYFAASAMCPAGDWAWMRRLVARLRRTAISTREKRARLVPSADLFAWGIELMVDADGGADHSPFYRATGYRDGLMIALLAARPFRRRNFASIEIGRHLIKRGDVYWLHFAGSETKTGEPIDAPFPMALVPYLERYLTHYRPFLARPAGHAHPVRHLREPGTALWVSTLWSAMSAHAIYQRIINLSKAKFGRPINPHLFRDSAATSIATEDPAHVYITRSILGHSTLETSERYYNHAKSLEAMRRHQDHVLSLRRLSRDSDPGRSESRSNGEA
jgi:integrase/recombinase XerD